MDIYREQILEHWQNPQNYGVINDADLVVEEVNPVCGDEITMYFKISRVSHPRGVKAHPGDVPANTSDGGRLSLRSHESSEVSKSAMIRDVSFTSSGCAISMASASILSEAIKGRSISEISKLGGKDILNLIGADRSFPPARLKCAFLALEAIRKLQVISDKLKYSSSERSRV